MTKFKILDSFDNQSSFSSSDFIVSPNDLALSNLVRSLAKFDALKAPRVLILEFSNFFYLISYPFLIVT